MYREDILEKMFKALEEINIKKGEEKVLVMHPTAMMMIKDRITRFTNPYPHTMEAFMFDNSIQVYPSFYLQKDHFTVMTRNQYEQFVKDCESTELKQK